MTYISCAIPNCPNRCREPWPLCFKCSQSLPMQLRQRLNSAASDVSYVCINNDALQAEKEAKLAKLITEALQVLREGVPV